MSDNTICNCIEIMKEGAKNQLIDAINPEKEGCDVHLEIRCHSIFEFKIKGIDKQVDLQFPHEYCPCCGVKVNGGV